jgi:hypothetical protein
VLNRPSRRRVLALAIAVFAITFFLRIPDAHLHNEQFNRMSGARQIVGHGNLPFRDFIDPGMFLLYWLSAGAQWLFGYSLLGEVLLSVGLLSVGTALAFILATEASRSWLIGLVVTMLLFTTHPHLYNYYKIFLTALAIWACWRFADLPTMPRLLVLAVATAIAAMTRADLGLYFGAGTLVTLLAIGWKRGRSWAAARLVQYGSATTLVLLPFLIFLQLNGGVLAFYGVAAQYGSDESVGSPFRWLPVVYDTSEPLVAISPPVLSGVAVRWKEGVSSETRTSLEQRYRLTKPQPREDDPRGRTWRYELADVSAQNVRALQNDPSVEDTNDIDQSKRPYSLERLLPLLRIQIAPGLTRAENALAWVYYLYWSLPILAILVAGVRHLRGALGCRSMPLEGTKIAAVAAIAALVNEIMLSLPTHNRMSDVGVPLAVLGAWLIGLLVTSGHGWALIPRRLAAVCLLGITWVSIASVANLVPQPREITIPGLLAAPRARLDRVRVAWDQLRVSPPIDGWDPARDTGFKALAHYARACTKPTDALLTTWYAPTMYFYTDREFGGGAPYFHAEHFRDPATQSRILAKLERQSVPIVLQEVQAYDGQFRQHLAMLRDYLEANYRVVHESSLGDDPSNPYRVMVHRQAAPTGTYGRWNLPCFN